MVFNLNKKALEEIQTILANPSLRPLIERVEAEERQLRARNLRGEVSADWLTDALSRMGGVDTADASSVKTSVLINEATGKPHTADSMVDFYKDRVGLNSIQKSSESSGSSLDKSASMPLSKKMLVAEDDSAKKKVDSALKEVLEYVSSQLSSTGGYSDTPAIIEDLKSVFDPGFIQDNLSAIKMDIEEKKAIFLKNNPPERPRFILYHQPQKVNEGHPENDNIFENIKEK